MRIENVVPTPYEHSIPPGIIFKVKIAYVRFHEAVIGIEGLLTSDDGKILAKVIEGGSPMLNEIGARGSMHDSNFKEESFTSTLIATLEKKALNHIENRRMKNKKRDVYLTLSLNVKSLTSRATISHLHQVESNVEKLPRIRFTTDSGKTAEGKIIAYAHDGQFSTRYKNMWIISGDGGPIFLSVSKEILKKENIRIPSPDWIHDYAPKLELGEYFIVEIAKGKMTIKKAWEYVEEAEECYRQWDTKGAYANCREVGKLLSEVIKKKFRKSPIIKKWKRAIEKFEKLTSLDLHEEDIKEEVPKGEISIGKVDTEHILIVTKALIKYAEELLQEKS